MSNHGPGTACNVVDWTVLVRSVTQEMKDRRKTLEKIKKRNRR